MKANNNTTIIPLKIRKDSKNIIMTLNINELPNNNRLIFGNLISLIPSRITNRNTTSQYSVIYLISTHYI